MNAKENLSSIRSDLRLYLGPEFIAAVHKPIPFLDYGGVLVLIVLLTSNFFVVQLVLDSQLQAKFLLCIGLTLVQGWLITICGLLAHDLFVHRRGKLSGLDYGFAVLLFLPLLTSISQYRVGHLRHHNSIGTELDTELYKTTLNTRFRRVIFLTAIGFRLAVFGKFSNGTMKGYGNLVNVSDHELRRIKAEKVLVFLLLLFIVFLSFSGSWLVCTIVFWIPALLVAPILNTIRILIEHADIDPSNRFWLASSFKTNSLSRTLFLSDSGDCHLLHHVFARVPWYRMPRLLKLAIPFFYERGVIQSDSWLKLLKSWFIDNKPHGTRW